MLSLLALNLVLTIAAADFVCPNGWKEYKLSGGNVTKCIKPFYDMVSRDEAQRRCQALGNNSTLVEIHSQQENDNVVDSLLESDVMMHLSNDLNNDMFNNYKPQVWIGPKRIPFGNLNEIQYKSKCGIKDYTNWHKGQPSDYDNSQNCVFLFIDDYSLWGQWVDYPCDTKMYYVCQMVSDPNPPCNQTNYNLYGSDEVAEDTDGASGNNINNKIEVVELSESTTTSTIKTTARTTVSGQNLNASPSPNNSGNGASTTGPGRISNGNGGGVSPITNGGRVPIGGAANGPVVPVNGVSGGRNPYSNSYSNPYGTNGYRQTYPSNTYQRNPYRSNSYSGAYRG